MNSKVRYMKNRFQKLCDWARNPFTYQDRKMKAMFFDQHVRDVLSGNIDQIHESAAQEAWPSAYDAVRESVWAQVRSRYDG